jgi:peptidoglycan hydrolase CwlO-like protein
MYAHNSSQNIDGQSDQNKFHARNDIQREIVMQESDLRKKMAEKTQIEAEIRKLKKDESRIQMKVQEKQKIFSGMDFTILQMEEAIKNLKKKLYLIK